MDRHWRSDTLKGAPTEMLDRKVMRTEVPDLAVVRARAVLLEVVTGVRCSPTAFMERLDALTDLERVEDANMLARWRAKYENEITGRMKSRVKRVNSSSSPELTPLT